jgi:hypothetical protein
MQRIIIQSWKAVKSQQYEVFDWQREGTTDACNVLYGHEQNSAQC